MKYVLATVPNFDAAIGRIDPGQTYYVDDDKAERWLHAGVAKPGKPPKVEEEDDENLDEDPDQDPAELAEQAKKLHEEGMSERGIAQQLGIARTRVHSLLAA